MAATVLPETDESARSPWKDFQTGLWQKEINVRDFIQQQLHAVRRGRIVSRIRNRPHEQASGIS